MDESEVRRIEQDAEVRRVLLAAADLLERDGWCQESFSDGHGRRCLVQAIFDSDTPDGLWGKAYSAVWRYVGGPAMKWQDTPGRTLPEVLSALRNCARG